MQPKQEIVGEKFFTKPLITIFITIFIDLVGFGVAIPVLPDYAKNEFGASPFVIGWLLASYSIMQFVSTPFSDSFQTGTVAARFCL
jgi:MFS family permease